jgi:hypothetical protein
MRTLLRNFWNSTSCQDDLTGVDGVCDCRVCSGTSVSQAVITCGDWVARARRIAVVKLRQLSSSHISEE